MSAGRHRGPIVLLETGTLISGIGNGVALVVLPWLVLEQTGSATVAGLVSAAVLLPLLASSVIAGTVVDRIGRKRTSVGSDLLSGVAAAAIPLVAAIDDLTAAWILGLAMLGPSSTRPASQHARRCSRKLRPGLGGDSIASTASTRPSSECRSSSAQGWGV
jgi:MFS family permease